MEIPTRDYNSNGFASTLLSARGPYFYVFFFRPNHPLVYTTLHATEEPLVVLESIRIVIEIFCWCVHV